VRRIGGITVAIAIALGGAAAAWRSSDAQRTPSARRASSPSVVATVGTLEVTREDLDRRAQLALDEFQRRSGAPVPDQLEPVVRRLYGGYLKANRQPQGMRTYNEVIAWLIAYGKKNGWEAI